MTQDLTINGVAEICGVHPRTAAKWFDAGRLGGYRLPGTQDRRVPREDLATFLRECGAEEATLRKLEVLPR